MEQTPQTSPQEPGTDATPAVYADLTRPTDTDPQPIDPFLAYIRPSVWDSDPFAENQP